jgi:hypothetical protein
VISGAVVLLALFLAVAWPIARALRSPRDESLLRWCERRGITLDAETRPLVHVYLSRSRRIRAAGTALGIALALLIRAFFSHHSGLAGNPAVLGVGGFLLASLVAELVMPKPVGPRRSAVLVPRAASDYVPAMLLWTLPLFAVGLGALALRVAFVRPPVTRWITCHNITQTFSYAQEPAVASIALAAVCLVPVLLAGLVLRATVRRPQRARSPAGIEVDDAIREASANAAVGAALGLLFLATSDFTSELAARASVPCGTSPMRFLSRMTLCALGAAVASWAWFSRRSRGVQRKAHGPTVSVHGS